MAKATSAADAVGVIKSGDRVFIHGIAAAPQQLINAMTERASELIDVEIVHLHTEGDAPYARPEFEDSFRVNAFFVGGNVRKAVQEGRGDYIPVFLSEIPALFRKGVLPLDVALIHVSPPDKHGFCSLGVSVDIAKAAVETAKYVIAQVNPNMPRTIGDALVDLRDIDFFIEVDTPLPEQFPPTLSEIDMAIGRHVADMIDDGATLQMGIGTIPNAVLSALKNHKHLGIHTEMFSDGLIDLVESGVVTGERKIKHPGKISQALWTACAILRWDSKGSIYSPDRKTFAPRPFARLSGRHTGWPCGLPRMHQHRCKCSTWVVDSESHTLRETAHSIYDRSART